MITSPAFAGKHYAILGLARSGMAAAEALLTSGAKLTAWDRQVESREPLQGRANLADPLDLDLTGLDGIVVSPGVPLNTHPIAGYARKFGVPVIGDIELFSLARPSLPAHKVVGITGTNGKSTTTALIHHICDVAGVPSLMGGNIGIPIMAQDPLPDGGVYVLELSSYQIDLTFSLDCDIALLLNITPDHLDRYTDFKAYAASKARLFELQTPGHMALMDRRSFAEENILQHANPDLSYSMIDDVELIGDPQTWPSLQGPHNLQNASAAIAVSRALGIDDGVIIRALASFRGLPHRMEFVAKHGGVMFINDSKATNADSTAPALAAYPPNALINGGAPLVHWIVGGLPKEDGMGACANHLGNINTAYTIGEAGPRFAELLDGSIPVERCELLYEAVSRAFAAAKPGEVILLSPACASFDQFRDYEKRGEHFRQIVSALTSGSAAGDGA